MISDALAIQIKFYSPSGEDLLRTVGRRGDGPGEFTWPGGLHQMGDTIVATDGRRSRLNYFTGRGEHIATVRYGPVNGRSVRFLGFLAGGMGVFRSWADPAPPRRTGPWRDTTIIMIADLNAPDGVDLGLFPANEMFHEVSADHYVGWFMPFGRDVFTAVSDSTVWVGVSDHDSIIGFDASGNVRRMLHLRQRPQSVTPADMNEFFAYHYDQADGDALRSHISHGRDVITPPASKPVYSDLVVDSDGLIWVRDHHPPWVPGSALWWVFQPNGRLVATTHIPKDLTVHQINRDHILARMRDELGVGHIWVLTLDRRKP